MKYLPWGVAALVLVIAAGYMSDRQSSSAGVAGTAPLAAAGAAPDISSMSPRERAARLYDRIMRYAEEGMADSIRAFAPMAMGAFDMLGPDMDLDARYDYGRVASEADEFAVAAAQADTILRASPTHLLGLALAARVADRQGRVDDAERLWAAFLGARESEEKKALPEYQAHAGDIEAAVRLASSSAR